MAAEKCVLITDHTWPSVEAESRILGRSGIRVVVATKGTEDELVALAGVADGILTCFASVTARVIDAAQRLQVIGRYGVGVDNIAMEQATQRGILVTNVPAYCLDEVAEHALGLLMALGRKLHIYDAALREGDWSLNVGAPIFRLSGKTLGILGFGRIGQTLSQKARGLGLDLIACDPSTRDSDFSRLGVERVTIEILASRADFISVHTPLTEATKGLVGREFFHRMKPSAFLVNTARGEVVDHEALLDALSTEGIAGAGIDVFEHEPLPPDHPLLTFPNVIVTPHVAFYSEESLEELEIKAAENVAATLSGRQPASVVNPEVLSLDRWRHLV